MGSDDGSDDVIRTPLISKILAKSSDPHRSVEHFYPILGCPRRAFEPYGTGPEKIWRPRQNPNRSDALLDAYFAQNTLFCSVKHGLWKENDYNFDE